jgi:hypothetical protein
MLGIQNSKKIPNPFDKRDNYISFAALKVGMS